MFAEERHRLITEMIAGNGKVTVAELSARFDITRETVRRDLAQLESEGTLRRVHGGAVSTLAASTREESHSERSTIHAEAKARIAQAAHRLLPGDGVSVMLDAGTSTEILAGLIAQNSANTPSLVITHALPIAARIAANPQISLELIGGRVRGLTSAATGAGTVEQFSRLSADIAFLGTNALHSTFGLSTPDPLEATVKTAMAASAQRVVVLADSSKFERLTLVQFAKIDAIDTLVTDAAPTGELAAALEAADVEVVLA
ncbi:DeoR/GlpR family DNA-binding transcription regulator [Paeniglutamicibacter sulfureus]|jgi:DeoR family fructose operon transcriptional repressor|uniref:Lactose phosphotransferase system repressor n=1 Tax=Paeniglutamicibacter sulfureus TaxID=43666 RepID=A0ABU2BK43_9MICC|nr:DeoR/GlpR family DNA-binding transcription regulator [Paeniglutamicibacter sulfureus]MDO2934742.1 DeoR/GlpR family DNA-binding transcription regulator [Paeniglutamicibacter sulfureus]MDR7359012.1 DeoR family fructose operon transcriptional repressor [Paeniglutamicibacter sulfureus]